MQLHTKNTAPPHFQLGKRMRQLFLERRDLVNHASCKLYDDTSVNNTFINFFIKRAITNYGSENKKKAKTVFLNHKISTSRFHGKRKLKPSNKTSDFRF